MVALRCIGRFRFIKLGWAILRPLPGIPVHPTQRFKHLLSNKHHKSSLWFWYCHANFTKYFTDSFWSDPLLSRVFASRSPCYFNTGVMVMDLVRWREGNFRRRIENWMELQRKRGIYDMGSLPPFLLVFGGNVEPIDHRWNQHGLGGDNVKDLFLIFNYLIYFYK